MDEETAKHLQALFDFQVATFGVLLSELEEQGYSLSREAIAQRLNGFADYAEQTAGRIAEMGNVPDLMRVLAKCLLSGGGGHPWRPEIIKGGKE